MFLLKKGRVLFFLALFEPLGRKNKTKLVKGSREKSKTDFIFGLIKHCVWLCSFLKKGRVLFFGEFRAPGRKNKKKLVKGGREESKIDFIFGGFRLFKQCVWLSCGCVYLCVYLKLCVFD